MSQTPRTDGNTDEGQPAPFLKWAGGKRWLARNFLQLFPSDYDRYIEPFLGGEFVFFALAPTSAVLADSNAQLIDTYIQIRENPIELLELLKKHQSHHCHTYYYSERKRQYKNSVLQRAAQFIYLNRTCWNGLYRVNLKGRFNVPKGTKDAVLLDTDDFRAVSRALKNVTLLSQDFSKTLSSAASGDFVYVDPPYTVNHKYNSFLKYNEKVFSWEDQIRLRDHILAAIQRGAKVAVSNADHTSIRDLYRDVGSCVAIQRQSVIAADPKHRRNVEEVLIRSWIP